MGARHDPRTATGSANLGASAYSAGAGRIGGYRPALGAKAGSADLSARGYGEIFRIQGRASGLAAGHRAEFKPLNTLKQ